MEVLYKNIRYLAYTIEILVIFIIGRIPGLMPSINGVKPMILVLVVIMIGLFEGKSIGMAFGFITGTLLDVGATGEFGFYAAAMTCIGLLVGVAAQKIMKFNLVTSVVIEVAFTGAFYITHFLFSYLLRGYSEALYVATNHYLIGFLYTIILSPFVYFFNKAFAVLINAEEKL